MLPRQLQLKHFCNMLSNCMMSKTQAITKICPCTQLTDTLNAWGKRFMMIMIMLCYFEIFTSCQGSMLTFSKQSKCKAFSIKFRKTLQERILLILEFSQDNSKNNFWTFWLLKIFYNIPGMSLEYFWNWHSWNVPRILWKYYFVITEIC